MFNNDLKNEVYRWISIFITFIMIYRMTIQKTQEALKDAIKYLWQHPSDVGGEKSYKD